jgi:DNA-binding transcriptional regulator PaaX
MSPTKQKILLLLLGGLAFGYSFTPGKQWKVLRQVSREWKKINEKELKQELKRLYRSKMIKRKENPDGSCSIILTEKGKLKILTYHFEKMKIKGGKWDGKWRMVIFDIPEKLKSGRNALRNKIKELGFYELQKSVWVFPYECKDEIDFIIEFFGLREYVRFGILESIDNELHLKKIFKLS